LPIVPPTRARVAAFLTFTERDPQDVLGVLRPEQRSATIWSVAVNGVMAGCRPEYMPILIAAVEAIVDPEFRIQDAGSTPAWEPMVILNGPIVDELDFNYGTGALRVGRQANSSVGRFLRLYMRNVAGLRSSPGETDKGAIGFTFNVALAEDYAALRELNWQPFSAARGFGPDDNVVTVQSITASSPPIYSNGATARQHMERIADVFGSTAAYWSSLGMRSGRWHPLLVMGPAVAHVLARDGWTKADVQQFLRDTVMTSALRSETYARSIGNTDFDLHANVRLGVLPPEYALSDDPERLVPVFIRADWIGVVVAGDPGKEQSKAFINNHRHGPPISRRIVLPRQWDRLRRR
jgi:hypothetical protein